MGGAELSCGNEPGIDLWQLRPAVGACPLSLSWSLFFIHIPLAQASGRRPGKLVQSLAAGEAAEGESALSGPQLGSTEKAHFVSYLLSCLGM